MTDDNVYASGLDVSRETLQHLKAYASLLVEANARQNLIGASTVHDVWQRHVLDSAQLARFATASGTWLDIGSGAGLPGIVLAIVLRTPVILCEPRRLRAEFLEHAVRSLGLDKVTVRQEKVAGIDGRCDYVTARAVASIDKIFAMSRHLTHDGTVFILPKGRSAQSELDEARRSWQGEFRLEASLTRSDAAIVVATSVSPRRKR